MYTSKALAWNDISTVTKSPKIFYKGGKIDNIILLHKLSTLFEMTHNCLVATRHEKEFWDDKARIVSTNWRRNKRCGQVSKMTLKITTVWFHFTAAHCFNGHTFPTTEIVVLNLRWTKSWEQQTLMSRIFCFSNSSMVSSSCLVVRVASIVALWSSLSAWWEVRWI